MTNHLQDNSVSQFVGVYVSAQFTGQGTPAGSNLANGTVGNGSGGSTGGGHTACVHIASFLPNGGNAGGAKIGDDLLLLNRDDDTGYHVEPVAAIRKDYAQTYRVTTASGITLICSDSTPITTRNGKVVALADSVGVEVPVLDKGEFRWEPIISLDLVGIGEVALINAGDGTYAAGEHDDQRYIFTHNTTVKP